MISLLAGASIFTHGVFVNTFIIMEARIKNDTVHNAKYALKISSIYKNIEMDISNNSVRGVSYIIFRTHVVFCVIVARRCDQIILNSFFLKHIQFMIHI